MEEQTADATREGGPARLRRGAVRHWALILALAYSAAIGAWQLPARGSVFVDEGYQNLESKWMEGKISYVVHHFPGSFNRRKFLLDDHGGHPQTYGKPLHALLGAVAIIVLPGSDVTAVLILQGLLGLAVIALVYGIARRLGGPLAGGAAAGVLALSVTWLAYRRSGLPEMDSTFFFALAVWALVVWSGRGRLDWLRAFGVGALTGLCFTANDRWYIALPIVLAMSWALDSKHGPWRRALGHAVVTTGAIVAGFLAPVAMFEVASRGFAWMAHREGFKLPYETYLQQLRRRYHLVVDVHHATPTLGQIRHSPYPGYLVSFEGQPWLLTTGAGSIYLLARWRREHVVPLLWSFPPLLLASASTLVAPRYMTLAMPGMAVILGIAVASAWRERARLAKPLAVTAMVVVAVSSAVHTPKIFRIRDGFAPGLAVAKDGKILSPKSYPVAARVGTDRVVLGYTDTLDWAAKQRAAGARWLLLEVWTVPGTPVDSVTSTNSYTVIGPLGDLSAYFLDHVVPVSERRFPPTDFVYEGFPRRSDRLILLYSLDALP